MIDHDRQGRGQGLCYKIATLILSVMSPNGYVGEYRAAVQSTTYSISLGKRCFAVIQRERKLTIHICKLQYRTITSL